MQETKQKKYYSLNLTEGRIFIIFISILLIMVIFVFGIVILISDNKNKDEVKLSISDENKDEDSNFSFYSDLTGEEDPTVVKQDNNTEKNNITDNTAENVKSDSLSDFEIELKNRITQDTNPAEKNTNQQSSTSEVILLDNSETLYSSNYTSQQESSSSTSNNSQTKTVQKSSTSSSSYSKRYIIQIGSYTDKKTAEDIQLYYNMQGYPTLIQQKDNDEKTFYRLRVGPFKEKDKAEKYLVSLKDSKYGKSSYISIVYL